MRLCQFLLLVVFTFVACSISITTAANDAPNTLQTISSNNEPVRESHRYLKGSKKSTKVMNAEDEERAAATTPSFQQYFGLLNRLNLPVTFSNLPGLKQFAMLQKKFGNKAGAILNLYNRFAKRININTQK